MGGYRFSIIYDPKEPDSLNVIDLGAGHSSSSESLCSRIINALKSQAILNETVTASYIERNWPPALKESGTWPLLSLRQSFLNGSLTRLVDPDTVLRSRITEFILRGEFGLASGYNPDKTYIRIWFEEEIDSLEVSFEPDVFLLLRTKVESQKKAEQQQPDPAVITSGSLPGDIPVSPPVSTISSPSKQPIVPSEKPIKITGKIPPDSWNRIGTKIIPKLRSGKNLQINVDISFSVDSNLAQGIESDLNQVIDDIGLSDDLKLV